MPITRKQFEIGISEQLWPWMTKIHVFLRERPNEAYSEQELQLAFAEDLQPGAASLLRLELFESALTKLKLLGAIEARVVRSTTYYAYKSDLKL